MWVNRNINSSDKKVMAFFKIADVNLVAELIRALGPVTIVGYAGATKNPMVIMIPVVSNAHIGIAIAFGVEGT